MITVLWPVIAFIHVHVCVIDSLEGSPAHSHSGYVHNSVTPQMERRRYSCKSPFLLGQPEANTRYDIITDIIVIALPYSLLITM